MSEPIYLFDVGDKFYETSYFQPEIIRFYEITKRYYVDHRQVQEVRYIFKHKDNPDLTFSLPQRTIINSSDMVLYGKRHPADKNEE
jgi:hypothetical protein